MATRQAGSTGLPTGTITFLFTDMEGSTRLVQALGERFADVIADHCQILRTAIAEADGVEALALAEKRDDLMAIGMGHHTVAQVARLDFRLAEAALHYRSAIRIGHTMGDAAALSEPLQGLAAVEIGTGDAALGVRLLAANAAIRERLGRRTTSRVASSR